MEKIKPLLLTLWKYLKRAGAWWLSVFNQQQPLGKFFLIIGTLIFACCLCTTPQVMWRLAFGPSLEEIAEATRVAREAAETATAAVVLPSPTEDDTQAEEEAIVAVSDAAAIPAATETAAPSATLAPTNTLEPTDIPLPSNTPEPSATSPPTDTPGPTNTPAPTDTPAPTNTPRPTDTPQPTNTPTSTPDPQVILQAAVADALGNGNRGVERLTQLLYEDNAVIVQWAINDNLSENLIKSSAKLDISDMLQAIDETGTPFDRVILLGSFPLIDVLGNTEEVIVVHAEYLGSTVEQIIWDRFIFTNVYTIASFVEIHPAFQE